jgi:hypothetical protein
MFLSFVRAAATAVSSFFFLSRAGRSDKESISIAGSAADYAGISRRVRGKIRAAVIRVSAALSRF